MCVQRSLILPSPLQANFKESYMAAFYDYFNEQKYADAVKNVSISTHHVSCDSVSACSDLRVLSVTVPGSDIVLGSLGSEKHRDAHHAEGRVRDARSPVIRQSHVRVRTNQHVCVCLCFSAGRRSVKLVIKRFDAKGSGR